MARKKSEKTQKLEKLLEFKEVVNAVEMGLGSKKGIQKGLLNEDGSYNKENSSYKKRQRQVLTGVGNLVEFMGLNPYEIVEKAREATQNPEIYRDLQDNLSKFMNWLITVKELSETTAKVYRGNALSLIKWNVGITIRLNHKVGSSNKKIRDQKLGIDNAEKMAILRMMFAQADLEMRAYIALSMASGWRPSDVSSKFEIATLQKWLEKDQDYFILRYNDMKENADIKCCLGKFQQKVIIQYMKQILGEAGTHNIFTDDLATFGRKRLFGDSKNTQRRLSEKFRTLLNQVNKYDENIITPHTMRSLVETEIVMEHGFTKAQAYQFTGHVADGVYIQLTDKKLIDVFKACEAELSLGEFIPESNDLVQVRKVAKILNDLVENQGKVTHCFHEFNGMDTESREKLEAEKQLEMELASFLYKHEEAMYQRFRSRFIGEIQKGKITL